GLAEHAVLGQIIDDQRPDRDFGADIEEDAQRAEAEAAALEKIIAVQPYDRREQDKQQADDRVDAGRGKRAADYQRKASKIARQADKLAARHALGIVRQPVAEHPHRGGDDRERNGNAEITVDDRLALGGAIGGERRARKIFGFEIDDAAKDEPRS